MGCRGGLAPLGFVQCRDMALTAALALNVTGHFVGTALYAMLVALVLAPPRGAARPMQGPWWAGGNRLALLTGLLGATWNLGSLAGALYTLSGTSAPAWVVVLAYGALGYLPAVVVHAVVQATASPGDRLGTALRWSALALATGAAIRHVAAAARGGSVPDPGALIWLTVGASILLALLLATRSRGPEGRRLWVVALAIFAVSGFHLTGHERAETWWMALIGHHASLPLAIAILQQEYRFAFADLFLKRALAMLVLATTLLGAWVLADALRPLELVHLDDPLTFVALLALWLATTMIYPLVRSVTDRVVDTQVLGRPDVAIQRSRFIEALATCENEPQVLEALQAAVGRAMDARRVDVVAAAPVPQDSAAVVFVPPFPSIAREARDTDAAVLLLPTVHTPRHLLAIGDLQHGRRLWSDDLDLLETMGYVAARRIDALRDEQRRLQQAVHEQEVGRLATEAELRAVRAQLHPHFLFNALNTVRYLIETSPTRAGQVLMELTGVLRGVLRRSTDEFSSLGEELELVQSYLAIEQARFEERLQVSIDVPTHLHDLLLPSLLLQPLVENAVRHGIAPTRRGGAVRVRAAADDAAGVLVCRIEDTGIGGAPDSFSRAGGVGLASVQRRLRLHYGDAASFTVDSTPGLGTIVTLLIPVDAERRRTLPAAGPPAAAARPVARPAADLVASHRGAFQP